GQVLWDAVIQHLSLLEADYFDLQFSDELGQLCWLDRDKQVTKQLPSPDSPLTFCVKFYTPDPGLLEDELTRYLFALQIKRDLATGIMPCSENTVALLASYIVQAEIGDFLIDEYTDCSYLTDFNFIPHQTHSLLQKIMEYHKQHIGETPSEADSNLLDTARKVEMYGIRLHPAKDHEGVSLSLAVAHMGVLVFQTSTKINTFSWAKIRKLSFKRKKFLIKLHPDSYGFYKDTVEFFLDTRNDCKAFWKKCIEHHAFFRCQVVRKVARNKTRVVSRGSSFRYSGRTQKQLQEFVRENIVKRPDFERPYIQDRSEKDAWYSVKPDPKQSKVFMKEIPSPKSSNTKGKNIFDLPSPAAAFVYSDDDSPPSKDEPSPTEPTFSTFRPDPSSDYSPEERPPTAPVPIQYHPSPSPPPPPPPPIFEEDYLPSPPSPLKDNNISILSKTAGVYSPNISTLSSSRVEEGDEDTKKKSKRYPGDDSYYMAKELLMTERTYKKDLEVVSVWFRNAISSDDEILNSLTESLFSYLDPIYEFHVGFLKDVELRMQQWEGKAVVQKGETCHRIGDLLLKAINSFEQLYQNYLNREQEMLLEIDSKIHNNKRFEDMYKDFESQKVCYLPLNTFFLKPGQRLLHYKLILERLIKFYPPPTSDLTDCREALAKLLELTNAFNDKMKRLENVQKLMELQRDLVGIESLVDLDRSFLREGCLQKYSRKGYQQRMFFLFSDMLVYTSRTATSLLQFKVHGQLSLKGMLIEENEQGKMAVQNSFAIYAGNKYILVAASSQEEKDKWIEDINEAILQFKNIPDDKINYPSLKSSASSTENVDGDQSNEKLQVPEKQIQHRANTTMHVCWHRNTSVSMRDHSKATRNQLSGYLLRKFKNSNGWQKLWVVFTNFCLFFYKSFQDDFPLASLPLLGYAVSTPEEEDGISKDHVFKLQFKNHIYFFRAESEYTFTR
ncbi:hypothetical protein LOTGIDRAFT_143831, partial [Lottia gigantea]